MKNRRGVANVKDFFMLTACLAAAGWMPQVHAQGRDADPFDRGSIRTSVVLGWGEAYSPDLDSAGGRAGIRMFASARTYFGLGAVIEYLLSPEDAYANDDLVYPDFLFAVAF